MKVNMRETDYYKSGKHKENLDRSREKSVIAVQEIMGKRIQEYNNCPSTCIQCSQSLEYKKRKNKFCSRSCSATHSNTGRVVSEEIKTRLSITRKKNQVGFAKSKTGGRHLLGAETAPRKTTSCKTCNFLFRQRVTDNKVYCSTSCIRRGGIREGSGRSKSGHYKGIYCGSSYELAFLIWNLDHNISIKRCSQSFEYLFNDETHRYYPDFEIDNTFYEIKGRTSEVDAIKIAAASAIMIDKEDIKPYIEYVASKYNVRKDKLWLLYDQQQYIQCKCCEKQFVKKHKKSMYCSNSCSMKGNRKLSTKI